MKKSIYVFLLIVLGTAFAGCHKKCDLEPIPGYTIIYDYDNCYYKLDEDVDNPSSTYGTLKIGNRCIYPFTVYINGVNQGTAGGLGSFVYACEPGTYSVHVEQASGFFAYPYEESFHTTIYTDKTNTYAIPTVTTGQIKFVSTTSDEYALYINNEYKGIINGHTTKKVTVDAWKSYKIRLLQQNGYALWPTEHTYTCNVDANYIYTYTFD